MTDFLDRLGDQMRAAQLAAPVAERALASGPRRRRHRYRVALAAAALLALTGPAAAFVMPWTPSLYRPGIDDSVTTSATEVSTSASDWLGVLRRPQTRHDREATAPLLPTVGVAWVHDVQTDGIRSLADGWALVPAVSTTAPGQDDGPALCIVSVESTTCGTIDKIRRTGLVFSNSGLSGSEFAGLVPDGVAAVRFTPDGGKPISYDVTSNFYDLRVDETATSPGTVRARPGAAVPDVPPPMPAHGRLEWLDASGNVVGPAHR